MCNASITQIGNGGHFKLESELREKYKWKRKKRSCLQRKHFERRCMKEEEEVVMVETLREGERLKTSGGSERGKERFLGGEWVAGWTSFNGSGK